MVLLLGSLAGHSYALVYRRRLGFARWPRGSIYLHMHCISASVSDVPQIFAISWGLVEPRTLCELYVFLISLVLGARLGLGLGVGLGPCVFLISLVLGARLGLG